MRKKKKNARNKRFNFKRGSYESIKSGVKEKYDSSWELDRFKLLDADPQVKFWTKTHGIKIKYLFRRRWRNYIPDILIQLNDGKVILEEIKGHIFQPRKHVKKCIAAERYCRTHNMEYRIIKRDDLELSPKLEE